MNKKPKLLIILNIDYFLISHRLPIVIEAINSGYDVHIAAQITSDSKKLKKLNLKLHPIKINRTKSDPSSLVKTIISIYYLVKRIEPDIIHLISIKPVLLGGFILHFLPKPKKIVFSISGLGFIFTDTRKLTIIKKNLALLLYKISLRHKNSKVIVQNKDDFNFIKKITKKKNQDIILIPGSGVDLQKFKPANIEFKKPIIIFPSRVLISKGVLEFIEAARILKSEAKFIICGKLDPECKDAIKQDLLESWVNENLIEFWGFSNKMEKTLLKGSIIVLPSYREGMPKVLCEAAACGKPIVTSDVPGCRESIIDGKSGILVPKKNPLELAKAIKMLIDDKKISASMGKEARKFAIQNFDIKEIVKSHLSIYSQSDKK